MKWINFLHIYQPPTLEKELLVRITKESYLNIIDILKKNPEFKITLNISACLTEYLNQVGYTKLIDDIKFLVNRGQIELVGSAAFHPLLPLLPAKEAKRQIEVNNDINKKYFGSAYNPKGFYLPEMAVSKNILRTIKQLGFRWVILDEISLDGKLNDNHIDYNKKYKIKGVGLDVIFRNRKLSKTFVPEAINENLHKENHPEVIITATDGELYGHKYIDRYNILPKILKNKNLETDIISNFLKSKRKEEVVEILDSSWESTPSEIKNNIPFSLWQHPKNKVHKNLWQLADFVLKLNYKCYKDKNHFASRLHMERGLASCTFWWASEKDFKTFENPAWSPTEVEKGALELLRSVRSLSSVSHTDKIKAEKIFLEIHKSIWTRHWQKEYKKSKCPVISRIKK